MRKILWLLTLGVSCLAVVIVAILAGAYSATQKVPEFYQEALVLEPAAVAVAGEALEQEVLELHNDARRVGHWEAAFTEEQINGWLSVELPKNFPHALPSQIQEPRIAIRDGDIFLACRYTSERMKTVLSLQVEVGLTENENEIALRVRGIRAGILPLPMKRFMDEINRYVRSDSLPLRWSRIDGDPLALLQAPEYYQELGPQRIRIEEISVGEGVIKISGRTDVGPDASPDAFSTRISQLLSLENATVQQ